MSELYLFPIIQIVARRAGLEPGHSSDLLPTDGEANMWEFLIPKMRRKALGASTDLEPLLLVVPPMCAAVRALQGLNYHKMNYHKMAQEDVVAKTEEALVNVAFAVRMCDAQVEHVGFSCPGIPAQVVSLRGC